MSALPYLRCERRPTTSLSIDERQELLAFALSVAPGLDRAFLLARFGRYEQAWIARRGREIAGFLLVQEYATPEALLVYIGPAFSRAGAYAYAFAGLLRERLARAQPFVIAMEVENPSVWRMLERLLPSHVFPRADSAPELPAALRDQAARLLAHVSHVLDFDPASMTSAMASRTGAHARYAVLLVPCDGGLPVRASMARELGRGLRQLCAQPAAHARETRDG